MSGEASLARRRARRLGRIVAGLAAATLVPPLLMVLFWGFLSRRELRPRFAWEGLAAVGDFLVLQLPYTLMITMVGVTLWAVVGRGRRLSILVTTGLFYLAGVLVHAVDTAMTWGAIALSPRLLPTLALNTFGWWGVAAAIGGLAFALIVRDAPTRAPVTARRSV